MVWQSQAILLLNAPGFPYGRTLIPPAGTNNSTPPQYMNLAGLTDLYSQFANGDDVKRLMRDEGAPATWSITAAPAVPTITGRGPTGHLALGPRKLGQRSCLGG